VRYFKRGKKASSSGGGAGGKIVGGKRALRNPCERVMLRKGKARGNEVRGSTVPESRGLSEKSLL